ncbi:MAG: hypothetical protein IT171_04815 [Acidobacteria bacterium]|nr:hypothetical protein [Acidobacteriota bacterium]
MISRSIRNKDFLALVSLILFAVAIISPIAFLGIQSNFDLPQHLRFAQTYLASIQHSHLYPIWAGSDNLGFGSAGIRVYPPLNYLLMSAIQLLTNDWYDTLWVTMLIWMAVGLCGMYAFARQSLPISYALASAIFFAIVPYHLIQVYQAFLLAEFAASAILPFCFLFAFRLTKQVTALDCLLFATSFSLLILTHIPSTIIGTACLAVYVLSLSIKGSFLRTFIGFALAAIISLSVTSFYWLRLVTEVSWIRHDSPEFYRLGLYNYASYLFPMFISAGDMYVSHALWLWDIVASISFLLLVPLTVLIVWNLRSAIGNPRIAYATIITGFFAFLMCSIASAPLWHYIETLQKLQFPWRWLVVVSMLGSLAYLLASHGFRSRIPTFSRTSGYALGFVPMVVLVFSISQGVVPSAPLSRPELANMVQNSEHTPGCECWWPIWANATAFNDRERAEPVGNVTIKDWGNTERILEIGPQKSDIRIATFYYPYWKAESNGRPIPVSPDADGTILLKSAPAKSHVRLYFDEPRYLRASRFVSAVIALLLVISLTILSWRNLRAGVADFHKPL